MTHSGKYQARLAADHILGATFVGPEVGRVPPGGNGRYRRRGASPHLAHAIARFPTRSELWLKFVEDTRAVTSTDVPTLSMHPDGASAYLPEGP